MILSVSRYLSAAELLLWHRGGGGEGRSMECGTEGGDGSV